MSLRTLLLSANRFECEAVSGDYSPKLGQGVFYTLSADVLRLFLVDISRWMQKIDFPIERYDTVQQDINAELDCAVFVFAGTITFIIEWCKLTAIFHFNIWFQAIRI